MEAGAQTAQAVLAVIESMPQVHNQRAWIAEREGCGTTRCVAGWALHLHGYSDNRIWDLAATLYRGTAKINYVAGQLLGLKVHDAWTLFHASNVAAVEALGWIALGKELDWRTIGDNTGTFVIAGREDMF